MLQQITHTKLPQAQPKHKVSVSKCITPAQAHINFKGQKTPCSSFKAHQTCTGKKQKNTFTIYLGMGDHVSKVCASLVDFEVQKLVFFGACVGLVHFLILSPLFLTRIAFFASDAAFYF